nr:MAG TPA: hypothetical protein [Crassvirales sp.]
MIKIILSYFHKLYCLLRQIIIIKLPYIGN